MKSTLYDSLAKALHELTLCQPVRIENFPSSISILDLKFSPDVNEFIEKSRAYADITKAVSVGEYRFA